MHNFQLQVITYIKDRDKSYIGIDYASKNVQKDDFRYKEVVCKAILEISNSFNHDYKIIKVIKQ